jgi:tetratricopeptide (TPR) repeat protein
MPRRIITARSAFVGHTFSDNDANLIHDFKSLLGKLGLECESGQRPEGRPVSEKVKERIRAADVFVGFFTRREKIASRDEWTTSSWVIEEKAMAVELGKPLLLFVEDGVREIGGLQGDYEYVSFSRKKLHEAFLKAIDYVLSLTSTSMDVQVEDHADTGGLYDLCKKAREAGNLPDAIVGMRKLMESAPNNARYLAELGGMLSRSGEHSEALPMLEKAVRLDPSTGMAHHELGHAYERAGRPEDALLSFQRALEVDPDVRSNYLCYAECLYRKTLAMEVGPEKPQTLKKVRRLLDSYVQIAGEEGKKRVMGYYLAMEEQPERPVDS